MSSKLFCVILFPSFGANQSLIVINLSSSYSPENPFEGKEYLRVENCIIENISSVFVFVWNLTTVGDICLLHLLCLT